MAIHCVTLRDPKTVAEKMIMEIDRLHVRCPVDQLRLPIRGGWWDELGYFQLTASSAKGVTLTNIWIDSRFRGAGKGGMILDKLARLADQYGVSIRLWAHSFDNPTMNSAKLRKWYKSKGYTREFGSYLYRDPQPTKGE